MEEVDIGSEREYNGQTCEQFTLDRLARRDANMGSHRVAAVAAKQRVARHEMQRNGAARAPRHVAAAPMPCEGMVEMHFARAHRTHCQAHFMAVPLVGHGVELAQAIQKTDLVAPRLRAWHHFHRSHICQYAVSGFFQKGDDLFPLYSGKAFQKIAQRVSGLQIIQQSLHRHARAGKNRSAAHHVWAYTHDLC